MQTFLIISLMLMLVGLGQSYAADTVQLLKPLPVDTSTLDALKKNYAKRHAFATLTPQAGVALSQPSALPGADAPILGLQLFADVSLQLRQKSRSKVQGNTIVINSSLVGDDQGTAVISITDGVINASIHTGDHHVYRVLHVQNGTYSIEELDQSQFPDCGNTEAHVVKGASAQADLLPMSHDDGSVITVLVAYTQAAETRAGGPSSIASVIATAAAESNTGYTNSGVRTSLQVVSTYKVNYTESGVGITDAFGTALNRITDPADGYMDEIHSLRDQFAADLVVLLIDDPQYCGLAWLPDTVAVSNANRGFSVVGVNCATGIYSFAHEIGHNMGARHDAYVDANGTTPYAYGHGYVNLTSRIRSIMAYNSECTANGFNCTRVNDWSASDRLYSGVTLGSTTAHNNDALNSSALTIANYRTSAATGTYTLTASTQGSGTVASTPSGISCGATCVAAFTSGSTVALSATPAPGYTFGGWGGACSGTGACNVSMSSAQSVTASFAGAQVTLKAMKSGTGTGTVARIGTSPPAINCGALCSESLVAGTVVTLTAAPDSGSIFSGWSGPCTGIGNCIFNIPGNTSVTANFSSGASRATPVDVPNIAGVAGASQYFSVAVPVGAKNLVFQTSGGTGDSDLYVRLDQNPTTSTFDWRSAGSTTAESISIATPNAGIYYVLVYGFASFSGVRLQISYDFVPSGDITNIINLLLLN